PREPSTARPSADYDPEIDLPLEGDPEPSPEFSRPAQRSMAEGIIAPPAFSTPTTKADPSPDETRAARVLDAEETPPRQRRQPPSPDDDLLDDDLLGDHLLGDLEPPPW